MRQNGPWQPWAFAPKAHSSPPASLLSTCLEKTHLLMCIIVSEVSNSCHSGEGPEPIATVSLCLTQAVGICLSGTMRMGSQVIFACSLGVEKLILMRQSTD